MSDLITPAEMARRFGVAVSTVKEWNRAQKWPHVRLTRGSIRWTEDHYAEIVAARTFVPEKPQGLPGQTARSASRGRRAS